MRNGQLFSGQMSFLEIEDYGPLRREDDKAAGKFLDCGKIQDILCRYHNFEVAMIALSRMKDLHIKDFGDLQIVTVLEIHDEANYKCSHTENNAHGHLEREEKLMNYSGKSRAEIMNMSPMQVARLNVKRIESLKKRGNELMEDNKQSILESSLTELLIAATDRETQEGVRAGHVLIHARETDHSFAVSKMIEIAGLHAQQARCVQQIMEIQDQLQAETALVGADLDQIAGIQAQSRACEARKARMEEQKKRK